MSFLFGGGAASSNPSGRSEAVESATTEIEMITDLFVSDISRYYWSQSDDK